MSKPSQIAYSVLIFAEELLFFLIDVNVDWGTPLARNKAYLVLFCSMQSCSILKITASFNFTANFHIFYGKYSYYIFFNNAKFSILIN